MTATVAGILLAGVHADRPVATAVSSGTLFSCSDHSLVYQSDGATWSTWADLTGGGGGGGTAYGAELDYPASFAGDDDDMSSTAGWADVSAFDTKSILNSNLLQLITIGASKDQRVRKTLGTTKAAAFDIRLWGVVPDFQYWGSPSDTYLEVLGLTSGASQIFIARLYANASSGGSNPKGYHLRCGSTGAVSTTNGDPQIEHGQSAFLRITRDGSNNLLFFIGQGPIPVMAGRILQTSDNKAYTPSSSGTLARIELSIHTPSGPASGEHVCRVAVDAFQSA